MNFQNASVREAFSLPAREVVGSPWEASPEISPASSSSHLAGKSHMAPRPAPREAEVASAPPHETGIRPRTTTTEVSRLAERRNFRVRFVKTSNLRKLTPGSVYRLPHLDRLANGNFEGSSRSRGRQSSDDVEPSSPFEQAWTRRRSARSDDLRWMSASSCSPPDLKLKRRAEGDRRRLGGATTRSPTEEGPESPGARIQRIAQGRKTRGRGARGAVLSEDSSVSGSGSEPDLGDEAALPRGSLDGGRGRGSAGSSRTEPPHGTWASEPRSPAKKRSAAPKS